MQTLAVSKVPLGMDDAMNAEITAIWTEVQSRVERLAQESGNEVNPDPSVEGILANLDAAQNPRKKKSQASERVKKTFDRTLNVIKNVGGIVANGASHVSLSDNPQGKYSQVSLTD